VTNACLTKILDFHIVQYHSNGAVGLFLKIYRANFFCQEFNREEHTGFIWEHGF